jgi:DNA-binding CsgD family transcriptional regulator
VSLVLSARDLSRYQSLVETLLAPLNHPDLASWARATLLLTCRLFHAEWAALVVPTARGAAHYYWGLDPEVEDEFRDFPWRTTGSGFVEMAYLYRESGVPATVPHHAVMGIPLQYGHAILAIAHSRPEDDPLGDDILELCHLVLPALRASLRALLDLDVRRHSLEMALDGCPVGIRVTDLAGGELYRNGVLDGLLARDPEREKVVAALHSLALRSSALRQPTPFGASEPTPKREQIRTATQRYWVGARCLAAGVFGSNPCVLVSVQSGCGILPTAPELQARFHLTPREAEVALLLACGASNHQIAEELRVSPHTARHHAQHVLEKLGVHTRKGLAVRFLSEA